MYERINKTLQEFEQCFLKLDDIKVKSDFAPVYPQHSQYLDRIVDLEITQRIDYIKAGVVKTVSGSREQVKSAIEVFKDWMENGTVVRLIGAGRARLAGAIPANRLAHGGARVIIQDDMIPMPHSIKGGGIIAVSASGKTLSVIDCMKVARKKSNNMKIVGIAAKDASVEFINHCHIFIGIDVDDSLPNPLKALADIQEFIIGELLDAIVVAAGKIAGFDDNMWRLGHEDMGATGPYDYLSR